MTAITLIIRLLTLSLAITLGHTATAADSGIYRSRDAQGNVIFSDRKDDAAEPVDLPAVNTMPGATATQTTRSAPDTVEETAVPGYRMLAITAPADGETIVNPAGYVPVSVAVEPALRREHSLRLLLDGVPAGVPPQNGSMALEGVLRGEHTLQLIVVDENGEHVQESAPVRVQVTRPVPKRLRRP